MSNRESRAIRDARATFAAARRDPSYVRRWLAWLALRELLEGRRRSAAEKYKTNQLLSVVEFYKSGEVPKTYAEAVRRARE